MKNIFKVVLSTIGIIVIYHFTILFLLSLWSVKLIYKINFAEINGGAVIIYFLFLLFSIIGGQIYLSENTDFYDFDNHK